MNLEWILNPATQYAAMALILFATLGAAITLKCEIRAALAQAAEAREAARSSAEGLTKELQGIRVEMKEADANSVPPAPGESMDLTKRSRALRMHHRGEEIPTIAAALKSPQNEIDLLLKIDQLLNSTQS